MRYTPWTAILEYFWIVMDATDLTLYHMVTYGYLRLLFMPFMYPITMIAMTP